MDGGERREDPRIRIEGSQARVAEGVRSRDDLQNDSLWLAVELVDLSAGGLSFRISREHAAYTDWSVGQKLSVHIIPTIGITEPLSLIVAVTHKRDDEAGMGLFHCQALDLLPEF